MGKKSTNQFDPKRTFRKLAIEMLVDIWEEYYKLKKYCKEKNSKFEEMFNVPKNEREILNSLVCTEIEEELIFLYFDYKNRKNIDYLKNSFDKKKDKTALKSLKEIISCWKLSDEDKSKLKDLCDSQQKDKSESVNSLINSWKVTKEEETKIADLLDKSEKKISKDRREKIHELLDVWKFIEKCKVDKQNIVSFLVRTHLEKKENISDCLANLENAFLYTYSPLPWKGKDKICRYPTRLEKKVIEKNVDSIVSRINNEEDRDYRDFASLLLTKYSPNIMFGVPQCIKGDITEAKLYHCLLNPGSGISDADNQYDNFYDYLHDKVAMKDHLRIFDENGHATKEKLVEYMNDLNNSMFSLELSEFIEHIVENGKVKNFSNNDEVKKILNDYFYYLPKYYASLFVDKGASKESYVGLFASKFVNCEDKDEQWVQNVRNEMIKQVNMCNLELIPLRSQDGVTVGNLIDENPFAVNVILRRIYIAELKNELEKPIFVFRSYYSTQNDNDVRWQDVFKRKTDNYDELYEYLINNYFLTHSSTQGGAYSKNNIVTISQEGRKGPKFKVEDYKDSGKTKGLENKNELASRAYKYIDDAQNAFISGLETE